MKFLYSLLLVVFLTSASYAQKAITKSKSRPDSLGYYMRTDHAMAGSEQDAMFVRLLIKADSGMYRVNDYYMDGTPRLVAKTSVDSILFEPGAQGLCMEYFKNGKRRSIKNYQKGRVTGDTYDYYLNGNLHAVETYSPSGIYLKQCLDSAGTVLADKGNGKWIKFNGGWDNYLEGNIVNGKEDGEWKHYVGNMVYNITYKQGVVTAGKQYVDIRQILIEQRAGFPGGDAAFYRFLTKNVKYPVAAKGKDIQGKVIVMFDIDAEGIVNNAKIVRGIGGDFDTEALRVVLSSPRWKPAISNGVKLSSQATVDVNFAE